MSKFKQFHPEKLRDYPLESRHSKVSAADFGRPLDQDSFSTFVDSLPNILAARDLRDLAAAIGAARSAGKAIIWAFGGHVVKAGLGPVMIDLMDRGFVTALATNGSGVIHDFEIALCGNTSEDVEQELKTGRFGMARETGEYLNEAVSQGACQEKGMGESIAEFVARREPRHARLSLLVASQRLNIPLTVHVAIGTDIIHNHPAASGEALGKGSLIDFRILTHQISQLHEGGVYINLGSAVILPEVFLKAVSMVRNSGRRLENFTTANLDFIQHYRPFQNVLKRPVAGSGKGIAITGHHEIMLPLLAAMLVHC
ncbi:MAG: hypothetical protein ACRD1R_01945 [Acidobacteriota bacterium]